MGKLTLSYSNRVIGGVCGGIGEFFGWDATIIRILFAIAGIVGFGSPVLIYLVLWAVMKFG